jgi:hypothetical protein
VTRKRNNNNNNNNNNNKNSGCKFYRRVWRGYLAGCNFDIYIWRTAWEAGMRNMELAQGTKKTTEARRRVRQNYSYQKVTKNTISCRSTWSTEGPRTTCDLRSLIKRLSKLFGNFIVVTTSSFIFITPKHLEKNRDSSRLSWYSYWFLNPTIKRKFYR